MVNNASLRGIARPYAKAVFEYAREQRQLSEWSRALSILADVVSNPAIAVILKNPNVSLVECAKALIEASKDFLTNDAFKNLLYLLAENRRLLVLPELFQLFEAYCAAYEKIVHVNITSAYPLSQEQKDNFATALKIRLQHDVNIKFDEDPKLIGGAVVAVDDLDLVIDGSVKTALARLSNNLVYS